MTHFFARPCASLDNVLEMSGIASEIRGTAKRPERVSTITRVATDDAIRHMFRQQIDPKKEVCNLIARTTMGAVHLQIFGRCETDRSVVRPDFVVVYDAPCAPPSDRLAARPAYPLRQLQQQLHLQPDYFSQLA